MLIVQKYGTEAFHAKRMQRPQLIHRHIAQVALIKLSSRVNGKPERSVESETTITPGDGKEVP